MSKAQGSAMVDCETNHLMVFRNQKTILITAQLYIAGRPMLESLLSKVFAVALKSYIPNSVT
jgi:hypothetical protein